jgi:hypothetical protein
MNDEIREEREGKRIGIFAVQVYLLFTRGCRVRRYKARCVLCFIHGEDTLISQAGE